MNVLEQEKFSQALARAAQSVYWDARRGMLLGETKAELDAEYSGGFLSSESYYARLARVTGGGAPSSAPVVYGPAALISAQYTTDQPVVKQSPATEWAAITWRGGTNVVPPSTPGYASTDISSAYISPSFLTAAPAKGATVTAPAKSTVSSGSSWLTALTDSLTGRSTGKTVTADFKLEPSIPVLSFPQQQSSTPWGTIALVGGGLLAAGLAAYFLLRKK